MINLVVVEKPIQKPEEKNKPIKNIPNLAGKKMGRNEPCFCGSGKKVQILLWCIIINKIQMLLIVNIMDTVIN